MKKIHTLALTGLFLGAAVLTPGMALAYSASATTSASLMTGDGTVRVWGAEVTDVSGSIITAVSTFGNKLFNWVVHLSGDTEVSSVDNAGAAASTSAEIKAGDRIAFVGALTSLGAAVSVDAGAVKEIATSTQKHMGKSKKDIEKHKNAKDDDKQTRDESGKRGWALGLWHHFFVKNR